MCIHTGYYHREMGQTQPKKMRRVVIRVKNRLSWVKSAWYHRLSDEISCILDSSGGGGSLHRSHFNLPDCRTGTTGEERAPCSEGNPSILKRGRVFLLITIQMYSIPEA